MIYRAQVETAGMAFEWEYECPAVDLTDPAAEESLRADIAQDCEDNSEMAAMDQGFFVESIEVVPDQPPTPPPPSLASLLFRNTTEVRP